MLDTFENTCLEEREVLLGDETAKIFLNTEGKMEDVSGELKAFLDYVAGRKSGDPFVQKLDDAVKKARQNGEWRREYMTLLMRDQENIEKGILKGREEGKIYGAISVYRDLGMPDGDISQQLQKKFRLSEKEAEEYLKAYKNLSIECS